MGILILPGRVCIAALIIPSRERGFVPAQDFLWFVLYSREVKAPEELVEKPRCYSHSVNLAVSVICIGSRGFPWVSKICGFGSTCPWESRGSLGELGNPIGRALRNSAPLWNGILRLFSMVTPFVVSLCWQWKAWKWWRLRNASATLKRWGRKWQQGAAGKLCLGPEHRRKFLVSDPNATFPQDNLLGLEVNEQGNQ